MRLRSIPKDTGATTLVEKLSVLFSSERADEVPADELTARSG